MSRGSQGPFTNGRLSLPLSKFSYATVHGESITPIPWIHLGKENNMFAVFETQPTEDAVGQLRDQRKFKVVQGPHVLEDIDLDILAREANQAKAEAQESMMSGKIPSVTVIVKVPCVAIRYPLEGGQIRRIQIRLVSNDDYYETLKIFTRINVPFGEAGSFPTPQRQPTPFSSSSSLLRPSDSASNIGARPASVSSNVGELPGVKNGVSVGWASANSLRPPTSSGLLPASPYGTSSNYFGQVQGGPASNPGRSYDEACAINTPQNGLVSGYFNSKQSHIPPPPLRSAADFMSTRSAINLYQPRPSTAPVGESQHLSQMLPPKRELPFPTSPASKKSKKSSAQDKTLPPFPRLTDSENSVSDAVWALENASELSTRSAAAEPAAKRKRVAGSRTPKPRAPKKQPAKAPAKKISKVAQERDEVPSVEELLEATQKSSDEVQEASTTIDTQVLLSRAEATRPYTSIEPPDVPEKLASQPETSTPGSQTRKCHCCRTRKGKCDGGSPCEWCRDFQIECTYEPSTEAESQILVPSSQPDATAEGMMNPAENPTPRKPLRDAASQAGDTKDSLQEPAAQDKKDTLEQNHIVPKTSETRAIDPDATLIDAATNPAPAEPHFILAPNTMELLLREPGFASSSQLGSWASLPESEQRSTLDTWMCTQFSDPAFVTLVKRLDESWQASLFGRSVGVEL